MRKKVLIPLLFITLYTLPVEAQQLVDNSHSTSSSIGNLANNAQIDVDALSVNPAGSCFYPNGFSISLGGLYNRRILKEENDYTLRGMATSREDNQTSQLVAPSIQLTYRNNNWAFSGYCINNGGYGYLESSGSAFNDELNDYYYNLLPEIYEKVDVIYNYFSKENLYAKIFSLLTDSSPVPNISNYTMAIASSSIRATAIQTSYGIGGSYKFNNFSIYIGAKLNHLKWNSSVTNSLQFINTTDGKRVSVKEYLNDMACFYQNLSNYSQEISEPALSLADNYSKLAGMVEMENVYNMAEKDIEHSVMCIIPVYGFDYLSDRFNLAFRYEMGHYYKSNSIVMFSYPHKVSVGLDYFWSNKITTSISTNFIIGDNNGFQSTYTSNPKSTFNREYCIGLKWHSSSQTSLSLSCGYGIEDMLLFNGMFNYLQQNIGIIRGGLGMDIQVTRGLSFRFAGMYSFLPYNSIKPFKVISDSRYTKGPDMALSAGFVVSIMK